MIALTIRVLYRSGAHIDLGIKAKSENDIPEFEWSNSTTPDGALTSYLKCVNWRGCSPRPSPSFFGLHNVEAIYTLSDSRYPEVTYDPSI